MKGYIRVLQWYGSIKHIDEMNAPWRHKGDAKAIDSLLGFTPPQIYPTEPDCPIGHIVFQVCDDGQLLLVNSNYDSSG